MELMREVFLYCIESNQMKPGLLGSICRYWRSVIAILPSVWSTLSVGTWTERERVAIWLQRAHPKKIAIDTERGGWLSSPSLAALEDALAHTDQWNELTISSFPEEYRARRLGVQVASRMNMLTVLHVRRRRMYAFSLIYSSAQSCSN